jgi:hypothetical protein
MASLCGLDIGLRLRWLFLECYDKQGKVYRGHGRLGVLKRVRGLRIIMIGVHVDTDEMLQMLNKFHSCRERHVKDRQQLCSRQSMCAVRCKLTLTPVVRAVFHCGAALN